MNPVHILHRLSLKWILTLPFHLCLGLLSDLLPSGIATEIMCEFSFSPLPQHYLESGKIMNLLVLRCSGGGRHGQWATRPRKGTLWLRRIHFLKETECKRTINTCSAQNAYNDFDSSKHYYTPFFLWRCDPTRVMASSFLRFLDHTQRRSTVGRTPLDEWSARRRKLYLTTHNTHNRQTSMPPVGFEPTISADERPQTYTLDRAATGTGTPPL